MRYVCHYRPFPFFLIDDFQGNYRIDQEDGEPDPHVIDLNNELGKVDECMASSLPEPERLYVFYININQNIITHDDLRYI